MIGIDLTRTNNLFEKSNKDLHLINEFFIVITKNITNKLFGKRSKNAVQQQSQLLSHVTVRKPKE